MEITLNKTNNTEGLIKIKLTEGDYQPHVEEKVKDYAKKANIKGFRQGKVPSGVIRKMFGKSILVDEINHLLSHKLSDYIKENNLKIIGDPLPNQEQANSIDWDTQKDFEFEYQIGMVEDFNYEISKNVKVQGYKISVDNKVLEDTLSDLKKRFGKVSYPESVEFGDNIFGDLRSKEGDFKKEHAFIASEKIAPGEQSKFIGKKKEDEVEFEVNSLFADPKELDMLLGDSIPDAKGTYVLKINTISRTEPAALDQELFDRVFGKDAVTTEEAFINKVKETIGENYERETNHFLEHHIEDAFLNHTHINIPDSFLKNWLKVSSNGQVTDDVLNKEYNDYVRGLKWDLIKNKIADDNSIKVEAEEVRNKAKDLIIAQFGGQAFAEQLKDRMDAIADNYLQSENGQNFMKLFNQLKNEKVLTHIKNNITIEEKQVTVDEFRKIVEEHTH
ncbi:trigger factor [Chryseosolibacter indicus]|uniref:Trigger factor n=1 Tax=Chryseosolibacter indicus TaxID=2782351 RepID=A0ABS5VZH7_9BACT|nr:trigger factor [Chryseosolibacter indicus]MBT1706319.1 trigger factor [Chryseosolibacter indicus]